MEIKGFWILFYFNGFSTQFPKTISKTSTLCSVLSQEDSKFAELILQDVKRALLFTSNTIILQFFETCSIHFFNSLEQDPTIESQKENLKNQFMQFALEMAVLEYSILKHCKGILEVNGNNILIRPPKHLITIYE
jgi:hypothetical protein